MYNIINSNEVEFVRIFLICLISTLLFFVAVSLVLRATELISKLIIKLRNKYFIEYEFNKILPKVLEKRERSYFTISYVWRVLFPEEKVAREVYVDYEGKKEWIDIEDLYDKVNVGDEFNATLVTARNKKGKFISNKILVS